MQRGPYAGGLSRQRQTVWSIDPIVIGLLSDTRDSKALFRLSETFDLWPFSG